MREQAGLVAIHQITGVGWHMIDKLFQAGWQPDHELTSRMIDVLKMHNVSVKLINRIREKWTPSFIKKVEEELKRRGIVAITPMDDPYPELLKEIAQPPWVLYVKGEISLLREPCLAIVGTRKPTPYGQKMTRMLSEQMVEAGWVVVSGMANGIDAEAHRRVLKANGKTVAVLGSGVDVVYPKNHRDLYQEIIARGAVISEMPPGTRPHPGLFPQRNRIISGLSYGTVVIEAAERSGSLITADFSMEQGREVFAVPGPVTSLQSRGTLKLIQQGAKCVVEGNDIFEEFSYILPVPSSAGSAAHLQSEPDLSEHEHEILTHIQMEPIPLNSILDQLAGKMTVGELHQALLSLEMKQQIAQLPGAQYIRK